MIILGAKDPSPSILSSGLLANTTPYKDDEVQSSRFARRLALAHSSHLVKSLLYFRDIRDPIPNPEQFDLARTLVLEQSSHLTKKYLSNFTNRSPNPE